MGKVAQAIAGALAGFLLAWGNYQAGVTQQSEQALFAIKIMYGYLPLLLIGLSILTMFFYDLDKLYPQIKKELKERRINS